MPHLVPLRAGSRRRAIVLGAALLLAAASLPLGGAPARAAASVPVLTLVQQPGSYTRPVFVTNAGDSRLFVVQQTGEVYVVGSTPALYLNLNGSVGYDGSERGLLGLAFDPAFVSNKHFFVYYTKTSDGSLQVSQFTEGASAAATKLTEKTVINLAHPGQPNHNGGMIAFGTDGYLYIGTGDGGGGDDPGPGCGNAQNTGVLLGKLLRILPGASGGHTSPPSNPFGNEVWSWGLRNPWRWSFDRSTHDLWIGDVGQSSFEEVDRATGSEAGKALNFGWPYYEGFSAPNFHGGTCSSVPSPYTPPLLDYSHSFGCAIVGGYVYRGSLYPNLTGRYLFSDNCSGTIWDVPVGASSPASREVLLDSGKNISSFGEDKDGELYVADLNGHIFKITSNVQRVYGADRFATSGAVAQFGGYATGGTVYIATGTDFPDALSGTPLAGRDGHPLLLVNRNLPIPASVAARLSALAPAKIVILGGTGAVSGAVANKLISDYLGGNAAKLLRYWGGDRYDTSAFIADPMRAAQYAGGGAVGVFVATGTNFPDALSGAPIAGSKGWPLLLVQPNAIPGPVATALTHLHPSSIFILGGTGVVSNNVAAALASYTSGTVKRLSGSTRYGTSAAIAYEFFHPTPGPPVAYIATGEGFADALSGAPLAARDGAPLLLVPRNGPIPPEITTELIDLKPKSMVIFGGPGAVSGSEASLLGTYCVP